MQDLLIAWPGLLIGSLEFVLGALWVFAQSFNGGGLVLFYSPWERLDPRP
jgi:hypothetical protein